MSEADRVLNEDSGLEEDMSLSHTAKKEVKEIESSPINKVTTIPFKPVVFNSAEEKEKIDLVHAEMDEEDMISFDDMLDIAEAVNSQDADKEYLEEFSNRVKVRLYLPLLDKVDAMIELQVFYDMLGMDTSASACELEMAKFWSCLLGRYTNIEIPKLGSIEYDEKCTIWNYDLCCSVFHKWIMPMVKDDYERLEKLIDKTISESKIDKLTSALEMFDKEALSNAVKSNEEFIKSLNDNKDLIETMKDIVKFNNGI